MKLVDDFPQHSDASPKPSRLALVLFPIVVCLVVCFWLDLFDKAYLAIAFFAVCGISAAHSIIQIIWKGLIVPSTIGNACPDCGERALELVSVVSFGPRYHRCSLCGRRRKRDGPADLWERADGPEDDIYYDPKRRERAIRTNGLRFFGVHVLALVLGAACIALGERFAPIIGVAAGFVCYLIVSRIYDRLRHPRLAKPAGVFDRDFDQL